MLLILVETLKDIGDMGVERAHHLQCQASKMVAPLFGLRGVYDGNGGCLNDPAPSLKSHIKDDEDDESQGASDDEDLDELYLDEL